MPSLHTGDGSLHRAVDVLARRPPTALGHLHRVILQMAGPTVDVSRLPLEGFMASVMRSATRVA
jgi:hypothetical protein